MAVVQLQTPNSCVVIDTTNGYAQINDAAANPVAIKPNAGTPPGNVAERQTKPLVGQGAA